MTDIFCLWVGRLFLVACAIVAFEAIFTAMLNAVFQRIKHDAVFIGLLWAYASNKRAAKEKASLSDTWYKEAGDVQD